MPIRLSTDLDITNRKILSLIQGYPDITQSEIARRAGISQSAVASRLKALKSHGLVELSTGIDLSKIGLYISRVDLNTNNAEVPLRWAKKCPLFLNGSVSVGGKNLSLYFAAEDIQMFQHIIDNHLRVLPGVCDMDFSPIVSWVGRFPTQLPLDVSKTSTPPCGRQPFCPRCPANPNYDGLLWRNEFSRNISRDSHSHRSSKRRSRK